MDLATQMLEFGRCARGAARTLAQLASAQKSAVLHAMADEIDARQRAILAPNDQDLIAAKATPLPDAMIDRLTLNRERLQAIAASIRDVSGLPDHGVG